MKKICFVFILITTTQIFSQSIVSEKIYAFTLARSTFASIDSTSDGYIASISQDAYYTKGLFMKINLSGDTLWKSLCDESLLPPNPVLNYNNTYFFSSLWFKSNNQDTLLFNLTKSKTKTPLLKKKYFFSTRNGFNPYSILIDYDNNILFLGYSTNTFITLGQGGGWKYTLLKTDTNGVQLFHKVYHEEELTNTLPSNIIKYPPHNYAFYGQSTAFTSYGGPYIMKVNRNYDTIASKTIYLATETDTFNPIVGNMLYTHSNHFVVSGSQAGSSDHRKGKSVVQKLDTNFNSIWKTNIGIANSFSNRIFELKNDTILMVTYAFGGDKIWLYKFRGSDGTIVDSVSLLSTVGGKFGELKSAVLRGNGQLAIAGDGGGETWGQAPISKPYFAVIQLPTGSRPAPVQVFGIEPTISSTCLGQNCTQPITCSGANCSNCFGIVCTVASTLGNLAIETQSGFTIYPNPSKGLVTVQFYNIAHNYTLQIYDAQGNKVQTYTTNQKEINLELSAGFYNFVLQSANGVESKKMVVE